jgi:hypothetical protein
MLESEFQRTEHIAKLKRYFFYSIISLTIAVFLVCTYEVLIRKMTYLEFKKDRLYIHSIYIIGLLCTMAITCFVLYNIIKIIRERKKAMGYISVFLCSLTLILALIKIVHCFVDF